MDPDLPQPGRTQGADLPQEPQRALAARPQTLYPGLPTGTGIGKYRILERIRTYHNAVVYRARDTMLDRLVAVKQMSPELMDSPVACGNFKREAQLLARVPKDCRYVVNVHELIEDENGLFIVEEYIEGFWLESLILKRQAGPRDALRLLRTAAKGLQVLHRLHIVHRDVNPGNILLIRNGTAKIGNFVSAAHEGDLASLPIITPKYAAPELLLDRPYDDRVDIYSLGMVLFEVCVGRRAMETYFADILADPMAVAKWVDWHTNRDKALPDAARLNPLVPSKLASIIRRMTAKNLDDRFSSVQEILESLAQAFREPVTEDARSRRPAVLGYQPSPAGALPPPSIEGSKQGTAYSKTSTPQRKDTVTHTVRQSDSWRRGSYRPPHPHADWRAPAQRDIRSSRAAAALAYPLHGHRNLPVEIAQPQSFSTVYDKTSASKRSWARRHRGLTHFALLGLVLAAIGGGSYIGWNRLFPPDTPHPIETLFAEGRDAYTARQFDAAEHKLREATSVFVQKTNHLALRAQAEGWLKLVHAEKALAVNDFDSAQANLDVAEKRGVTPARIHDLQQRIWQTKDTYRLAAAGYDDIHHGRLTSAENKLAAYEKQAASAGLDPERLKEQLDLTKRDTKYNQAMKSARAALERRDYDAAMASCIDAESLKITNELRELRQRVSDLQKRSKAIARADRAMVAQDYLDAMNAYEEANLVEPSTDIETKFRTARAHVLLNEANAAISNGDLLAAEDKLKSCLWNSHLREAEDRLNAMRPAFEAAKSVRRADRALESGNLEEAKRLYNEAMPRLPAPADSAVRAKMAEIGRLELVKRGIESLRKEDWKSAITTLETAQKIHFDPQVEELLIQAKAHLP